MPKATFNGLPREKRERVLTAATDLFAERGFHRTEMDEIARRAGISKGSLYNYFKSKDELFLHICNLGIHGFRESVWREIPADWDIYRQVEELFRREVPLILEHPQNFQIYLNLASSGMKRFADRYTRKGEEFGARRLKALLREGIARGIVRPDLDIRYTAFLIHSLSLIFMASLVSQHFQIRFREYLGIKGELNSQKIDKNLREMIRFIHQLLRPSGLSAAKEKETRGTNPGRRRSLHV
jgi:TetR/AcrR family transcriptional regulator